MGFLDRILRRDAAPAALPPPLAIMPPKRVTQYVRADSLVNPINGLGILGGDRRMGARYDQRTPLVLTEQYWMFKQTWLAARICEAGPKHCARAWFKVNIKNNHPDASKAMQKRLDKRRVAFKWAATLANITGGSLLALGVDDGLPPELPVNPRRIRRLMWARSFDRWYAYPSAMVQDPMSERFGEPAQYAISGQPWAFVDLDKAQASGVFDASRVIRFDGNLLPDLLKQANQGWNDSILERVYDALRDANQGCDAGAKTLTDFTMTILKIVGFSQDQLNAGGEALDARVQTMSQTMSTAGVVAADSTEEVERVSHKISGFDDVLNILLEQVAGAAEIPRVILYGQAGGTSRAGADTDVRGFYDNCLDVLGTDWEPKARQICEIEAMSVDMRKYGIKPDDIELTPGSLWEEEPETTAKIMQAQAAAVVALAGTGTLTPEQTHRVACEVLKALGIEVDEAFVADLVAAAAAPPDVAQPANPGAQGPGAMPPTAGRDNLGMPIIPGADSNAAGGM